jgi:hypothetical protein
MARRLASAVTAMSLIRSDTSAARNKRPLIVYTYNPRVF